MLQKMLVLFMSMITPQKQQPGDLSMQQDKETSEDWGEEDVASFLARINDDVFLRKLEIKASVYFDPSWSDGVFEKFIIHCE